MFYNILEAYTHLLEWPNVILMEENKLFNYIDFISAIDNKILI